MGNDHHYRQLDPLPAVDRAGIGQLEPVGLFGRQPKRRLLAHQNERRLSVAAAKLGRAPRRMACAPCTIMLPAAWRKMCVSLTVGTSLEATSSANGLPAPTGASWSASPTRTMLVLGPTARSSVTISSRFAIEDSSTISRSHGSGSCSSCSGPSPGIQPSAECTVRARTPLASLIL